jgi:hypothetical protein
MVISPNIFNGEQAKANIFGKINYLQVLFADAPVKKAEVVSATLAFGAFTHNTIICELINNGTRPRDEKKAR